MTSDFGVSTFSSASGGRIATEHKRASAIESIPGHSAPTTSLYSVLEVHQLTPQTYILRLERGSLAFKAGQCVNIGLPEAGVNREYSTYSGETDPYLDFLIKEVEHGIVSVALKAVKPGDQVQIHGAYGEFCLQDPNDGRRYVFIGTGTGIAPFHSFIKTHPNLDYQIIHGIRYVDECYGIRDYDPTRYSSCVSRGPGGSFQGRVTDYLHQNPVEKESVCYLCGNRAMINRAYELLRAQGVSSDNLFAEVFF